MTVKIKRRNDEQQLCKSRPTNKKKQNKRQEDNNVG